LSAWFNGSMLKRWFWWLWWRCCIN